MDQAGGNIEQQAGRLHVSAHINVPDNSDDLTDRYKVVMPWMGALCRQLMMQARQLCMRQPSHVNT